LRLVIASRNRGKVKEFRLKLGEVGIELLSLDDFENVPEVEETGGTFLENAYVKAREYSKALGLPVISDDSGLEVDALGGLPGVMSSRFAGEDASDEENVEKLIEELRRRGLSESRARFRCFIFLSFPEGYGLWSEGTLEGKVITERRGSEGFGYDPIFIPEGEERTVSQMGLDEKNRISHRARAIEKIMKLLRGMSW